MQFSKSLLLLAALTTGTLSHPAGHYHRRQAPTDPAVPSTPSSSSTSTSSSSSGSAGSSSSASSSSSSSSGGYSTAGFGASTAHSGADITYKGNVGNPWGSNIIEVSSGSADSYQHVLEISGQNTEPWTVVFWNKYGPDGQMTGWYGNSALTLTVNSGETKYVALADDSNGGFAAAPSSSGIPTDNAGGYASTWGEFDFSSAGNAGWSGFDVSAIAAQNAGLPVQGMKICDAASGTCSSITKDAATVDNAYTSAETDIGGIGGNIAGGGQVKLAVTLDYSA
ncbi:hypothetical protein EYZ11_005547 [Aspergillus tanneri]|uniref:Allergen Asp f 4 n=1 Tax=Aspergillus tanneri TaxID=1220188 RepID=A0A4V3UPF8_9EURO|nr:hypothetical protein EYZ11_005547 [Aspergillus tanneri]